MHIRCVGIIIYYMRARACVCVCRRGHYHKIYDDIILFELAHYDIITAIIRHVMQLVRSQYTGFVPILFFVFFLYKHRAKPPTRARDHKDG